MEMKTLRCGRCRHDLALFKADGLSKPLKAEMFVAKFGNYPEPFRAGQEWPFLLCTACGMNITMDPRKHGVHPDFVYTPEGRYDFVKKEMMLAPGEKPLFECEWCHKTMKSKGGLGSHKRYCKERPADGD